MRKVGITILICLVILGLSFSIVACSGQSNEVVIKDEQPQTPETQAARDKMLEMLRQSRQIQPPSSPTSEPPTAQNTGK